MKSVICILSICCTLIAKGQTYKYTNHIEAGIMIGLNGGLPFTLQMFNGVKLQKSKLDIGITAGIDSYQQMVLLPLTLGIRYPSASSLKTRAYVGFDTGYSFDWLEYDTKDQQYGGGWIINPTVGLKFRSSKANKITLSLGYKHQLASLYSDSELISPNFSQYTATSKYSFNRITFRVGLSH